MNDKQRDGLELLSEAVAADDGKRAAELLVSMFSVIEEGAGEKENYWRRRRRWTQSRMAVFAAVPKTARIADLVGLGADDVLEVCGHVFSSNAPEDARLVPTQVPTSPLKLAD
jgi:hypothetical protein